MLALSEDTYQAVVQELSSCPEIDRIEVIYNDVFKLWLQACTLKDLIYDTAQKRKELNMAADKAARKFTE